MVLAELLCACAALLIALFYFLSADRDFFEQKRVPHRKPYPLLGNMAPLVLKRKGLAQLSQDFYAQFKEWGVGGVFEYTRPVLVVCELDLVRQLCVRECESFVDHEASVCEDSSALFDRGLPALSGQRWRDMRAILSTVFSSERLDAMLPLVARSAQRAVGNLDTAAAAQTPAGGSLVVELRGLFRSVVTEMAAAAAFGLQGDSDGDALEGPASEFAARGTAAADPCGRRALVALGRALAPSLMEVLGVEVLSAETKQYFRSLVLEASRVKDRGGAGEGVERHDVLHLLVAARHEALRRRSGDGDGDGDARPQQEPQSDNIAQLSDDDIAAQVLLFFVAGFEPTTTLLCFLAHQLAEHPSVQERARGEVEKALAGDGRLTPAVLQRMKYLDMVISETLRLYPPSPVSAHTCRRTFPVKGTDRRSGFVVRPGDTVWVPVYALHRDPAFFPDPDAFDPERFSDANKHNITPYTFLPFGSGPRDCMGMQFALLEVKVIIAFLLTRFNIKVIDKTPVPLKLSKKSRHMTVDEGFWVGIEPRKEACPIKL